MTDPTPQTNCPICICGAQTVDTPNIGPICPNVACPILDGPFDGSPPEIVTIRAPQTDIAGLVERLEKAALMFHEIERAVEEPSDLADTLDASATALSTQAEEIARLTMERDERGFVIAVLAATFDGPHGWWETRRLWHSAVQDNYENAYVEQTVADEWRKRKEAAEALAETLKGRVGEEFLEFKEALADVRALRQEHRDLSGGGPGWSARYDAAWARVDELFANEDEAASCRQQGDAHG